MSNRPVPAAAMCTQGRDQGGGLVCVRSGSVLVSSWTGGTKDEKRSQNQVSRCHTHSGTGNWRNVR